MINILTSIMHKNRERIIETGLRILAQNPAASMDQIAEEAGIGRATLYRHFGSKNILIRELYFTAHRMFEEAVLPILDSQLAAWQKLEKVVTTMIPLGASFQFMMFEPMHTDDPELEALYNSQLRTWRALIVELKSAGLLDPGLSDAWIVLCLDSMIFAAWEGIFKGDIARNEAPSLVLRTLMNGVGRANPAISV